jgi:DNA-binding LacI/PurR family transcriptional regulator
MLLCNSSTNAEKELQYLQMLKMNQVDGIITISYHDYYAHKEVDLPLVAIDRFISDKVPHVSSDNYAGGRLAAEKLIEAGCKKLAYVGGEPKYRSSVTNRKIGLIDVATEHKVPYIIYEAQEEQVIGNSSKDIVRSNSTHKHQQSTVLESKTAKAFVNEHSEVDGIFTSSDLFAGAIIKALYDVGKSVPEDVKVIGFDGIQFNDYFRPILSTIVQPVEKIGRYSVNTLLDLIEGKEVLPDKMFEITYKNGDTC